MIRLNSKTPLENAFYILLLDVIPLCVIIWVNIDLWFYSILKKNRLLGCDYQMIGKVRIIVKTRRNNIIDICAGMDSMISRR